MLRRSWSKLKGCRVRIGWNTVGSALEEVMQLLYLVSHRFRLGGISTMTSLKSFPQTMMTTGWLRKPARCWSL